ncbi:NADH-quinone oxidoreductase subunit N [Actinomadura hibisca]|uniref:NADH-quinone oxidoreductase subunit N n=1 Tax=Actinomadura hibisca TaxID=68565 RepID=UPI000AAFE1AC|nr:NADH-quinone oxidoreductase subunit N [Actinomadura hibisca]
MMMNENPADLLPELCVLGGAVLGLLCGMFLPRARQWIVGVLCAAALVAGLVFAGLAARRADMTVFESFVLDPVTHVTRGVVLAATLFVVVLAMRPLRGDRRETEFYVLVLLAALGAVVMGMTSDLLVLVAGYLVASIPAYALAGFAKDAAGTEAALKYYLMGAFFGIFMLAGIALLYGAGRATSYEALGAGPGGVVAVGVVGLLAGLFFKAGVVPAHFWVPDVAQGASRVVAAFVTTVPKVGAFAALYRVAVGFGGGFDLSLLLALVAAATMTLGNLAAFGQDNVRRLLGYSTISQAGYLLVPVAVAGRSGMAEPAVLYYLAAYAITNVGAFAVVVAAGRDEVDGYRGFARRSPLVAVALVICLLGLIGTPPTAVFVGKLLMFGAAVDGGYGWLAVVAAVNSVASVFYYLRWVVPMFARGDEWAGALDRRAAVLAVIAAVGSVVVGVGSGVVLAL